MKQKIAMLIVTGILLFLLAAVALSAPTAMKVSWWTIDGGGGRSSGGQYTLSGTIGQPDAGRASQQSFTNTGGFWALPTNIGQTEVYLPMLTR